MWCEYVKFEPIRNDKPSKHAPRVMYMFIYYVHVNMYIYCTSIYHYINEQFGLELKFKKNTIWFNWISAIAESPHTSRTIDGPSLPLCPRVVAVSFLSVMLIVCIVNSCNNNNKNHQHPTPILWMRRTNHNIVGGARFFVFLFDGADNAVCVVACRRGSVGGGYRNHYSASALRLHCNAIQRMEIFAYMWRVMCGWGVFVSVTHDTFGFGFMEHIWNCVQGVCVYFFYNMHILCLFCDWLGSFTCFICLWWMTLVGQINW